MDLPVAPLLAVEHAVFNPEGEQMAQMPPKCCHKKKAMPMLASMWPSFRHNGILQFADGKLRHKNVSWICWPQGGFAGNICYGEPKSSGGRSWQ
jgi:hypothetical protein